MKRTLFRAYRCIPCSLLLLLLPAVTWSQESTFQISGIVRYSEDAAIHIMLFDKEQFKVPFTGIQHIVLAPSTAGDESTPFVFRRVEPGRYGIRAYQDLNGNGKLDKGLFGPKEPWAMTWNTEHPRNWPQWEKVSFPVEGDVEGVELNVRCRGQ